MKTHKILELGWSARFAELLKRTIFLSSPGEETRPSEFDHGRRRHDDDGVT